MTITTISTLLFTVTFLVILTTTGVRSQQIIKLPSSSSPNTDQTLCPISDESSVTCPVNCFRTNPVCGADGITYWCGCADAHCSGVKVEKMGFCEVGNGGSGMVSGQALLLVHIVWLIVLGVSVLFGLF